MNKIKYFLDFILDRSSQGAIALILVVMITALTIVSAVVVAMVNTSDMMSSYALSESEQVSVEMDACLEDALWRLASSSQSSGTYYLTDSAAGINCYYQIASGAPVNGLKTVTSTASTTSSVGYWENTVVVQVNVSSTPVRIYSYQQAKQSYASYAALVDNTAPAAVSNLATNNPSDNSMGLSWTAPGDDGSTGTAASYDVRYSTSNITDLNWSSASQASGEPTPSVAGSSETMTVSGLTAGRTYYFAIKTSDEVPNISNLSNVPSESTTGGSAVCGNGILEGTEVCDYNGWECEGNLSYSSDNYVEDGVTCNLKAACRIDLCNACITQAQCDGIIMKCFAADTEISMADGSKKLIQDVQEGDRIISWNFDLNQIVEATVKGVWAGPHHDIYLINNKIRVTREHPFFTREVGWASIEPEYTMELHGWEPNSLIEGYHLLDENGQWIKINSIILDNSGEEMTYNLTSVQPDFSSGVETCDNNNYFADGVLVHNKFCAYLFSQEEDDTEHFEFVTLGVFEEPGNFNSRLLSDRMFIENEGYSYINLEKETNRFVLRIPPHEIDYIDYLGLKVIDTLDENNFSFIDKVLNFFGLLDKEKVYNLQLVDSSEGYDLLVSADGNRFALDGQTKYPHVLSLVFEELPAKEAGYVRKIQFVEKGYYEAFEGSNIWYDFAPFNQTKWRNWLDKDDNYNTLEQIIEDIYYNHYQSGI